MKKLITWMLIICILIGLGSIAFAFTERKDSKSLETHLAFVNKKKVNDSFTSEEEKLIPFLKNMGDSANNSFKSTRINIGNESIDQTYYYIKILELLNKEVDSNVKEAFKTSLISQLDEDPFLYAYLDAISINKSGLPEDIKNKLASNLRQQLRCKDCLNEASPYLIYYISKNLPQVADEKSTIMLSQFILEETEKENLIYYLYWYFALVNEGNLTSENHLDIIEIANNLVETTRFDYYKDPQTLFTLYSLSALLDVPYNLESQSNLKSIKKLNYNFNLHDVYFTLKLLSEPDNELDSSLTNMYYAYLKEIMPSDSLFYPLVVFEENNMIEIIAWQLIRQFIYDVKDPSLKNNAAKLQELIVNNELTSSQTELYYQILFFKLNNMEFPKIKSEEIKEKLNSEIHVIDNYHLFQAGYLIGYELNNAQVKNLKLRTSQAVSTKNVWEIIISLDLNYMYSEIPEEADIMWEENKDFLEKNKSEMSELEFFLYQLLKDAHGETLKKSDINNYFNVREVGDMVLLDGDSDILNLTTIYFYLSLLQLTKNKDLS